MIETSRLDKPTRKGELGDTTVLVNLLAEYSEKTKKLSEDIIELRGTRGFAHLSGDLYSLAIGSVLAFLTFVALSSDLITAFQLRPYLPSVLWILVGFSTSILLSIGRSYFDRNTQKKRHSLLISELTLTATQLKEVVMLASQVEDHVADNDVDKLLFRLRIVEAESALRLAEVATGQQFLGEGTPEKEFSDKIFIKK